MARASVPKLERLVYVWSNAGKKKKINILCWSRDATRVLRCAGTSVRHYGLYLELSGH